ncbi:Transcriptional regulator, contains HTH domain [Halorhabdus sp. SVX81]|uniref:helix-turn-helix domain-containing protein n=1 Tax=Halorhabdus sp. SVX81 TaxID=2978283 RepID=UPI0023DC5129|nr:helix-turn-helix domain-containing protein [Halorhabdus sp. SVX81]WEL16750.1 Transcriptional regulator, contains HTH domain [Halorhabdus sp. SVX81]
MDRQTIIAELDVTSPRVVLGPTLASDYDVTVYAERLPVSHEGTTWFHVTVLAADFDAFEEVLAADPTVANSEVFAAYGDRRTYRLTIAPEVPVLTEHVASFGDELLDLRSTADGWRVRIRTTDRGSIREFLAFCAEQDIDCRLARVFEASDPVGEMAVPVERDAFDILHTAYDAGYFEVPRETSLAELADRFDVSESTMSVRLRRALGHVVASLVAADASAETTDSE